MVTCGQFTRATCARPRGWRSTNHTLYTWKRCEQRCSVRESFPQTKSFISTSRSDPYHSAAGVILRQNEKPDQNSDMRPSLGYDSSSCSIAKPYRAIIDSRVGKPAAVRASGATGRCAKGVPARGSSTTGRGHVSKGTPEMGCRPSTRRLWIVREYGRPLQLPPKPRSLRSE